MTKSLAVVVTLAALLVGPAMRWPDDEGAGPTTGPMPRMVLGDPASPLVLVNKMFGLPSGWTPSDLVEPHVRFTFSGSDPKRLMRPVAAAALEALFAAAERDGVPLAAVSGFRSEDRQQTLFDGHARRDGEAEADRHTARPGHSEHQTGLAMDVTGADGRCAASSCFGGTPAARWLATHAPEHGFVIRYPDGKEAITGYDAEPWHLRYVGVEMARTVTDRGLTLDEAPRSPVGADVVRPG